MQCVSLVNISLASGTNMKIISERVDHWGNRVVVWEDDFGDCYRTTYYADGGESTECV